MSEVPKLDTPQSAAERIAAKFHARYCEYAVSFNVFFEKATAACTCGLDAAVAALVEAEVTALRAANQKAEKERELFRASRDEARGFADRLDRDLIAAESEQDALRVAAEKSERVFQAVVYAFEGKPVPADLETHGFVSRARKCREAAESERDALRVELRESFDDSINIAKFAEAKSQRLDAALRESVKLQSHYAGILNDYDGGQRMTFASAEEWLERLAALADPPSETGKS